MMNNNIDVLKLTFWIGVLAIAVTSLTAGIAVGIDQSSALTGIAVYFIASLVLHALLILVQYLLIRRKSD